MKQRIISGVVGLALLAAALYFCFTIWFNIIIGVLAAVAVFEVFTVTGLQKHKFFAVLTLLFALAVPIVLFWEQGIYLLWGVFSYVLLTFFLTLFVEKDLRFEQMATVALLTFLILAAFCSLILIRDINFSKIFYENLGLSESEILSGNRTDVYFWLMQVFICAWGADTGAYFSGMLFGKHKLAPKISPKKTIEGAIGGVLFAGMLSVASLWVWCSFHPVSGGDPIFVNYLLFGIMAGIGSLVGMLGDLTMSYLKRNHGVKDFGNIMPGHGGVLDRFDSILLVAPFVLLLNLI